MDSLQYIYLKKDHLLLHLNLSLIKIKYNYKCKYDIRSNLTLYNTLYKNTSLSIKWGRFLKDKTDI